METLQQIEDKYRLPHNVEGLKSDLYYDLLYKYVQLSRKNSILRLENFNLKAINAAHENPLPKENSFITAYNALVERCIKRVNKYFYLHKDASVCIQELKELKITKEV